MLFRSKMLSISISELEEKANTLYDLLGKRVDNEKCKLEVIDDYSEVGGGSLPLEKIPTKCIMISLNNELSISKFEKKLREYKIPLIIRVYKDKVYIDLRTIREDEFNIVVEAIVYGLKELKGVH